MSTQFAVADELEPSGQPRQDARAGFSALTERLGDSTAGPATADVIASHGAPFGMVGESAAVRRVLDRVARVAATGATVLVTGETGTGKELIARAIHAASPRAKRPFVTVNCAALPEGVARAPSCSATSGAPSRGPSSGARVDSRSPTGGTIFLDEVGELSPALQVGAPARAPGGRVRARRRARRR